MKQSEEQVAAQNRLTEFFAGDPEAFALAYSPENLAAYIVQSEGWPEFAEAIEAVQAFSELKYETLSGHVFVGAYTKFKQLGTAAAVEMNKEYLRESSNHSDLTVDKVWALMGTSKKQAGLIERGRAGEQFAKSTTPKVR